LSDNKPQKTRLRLFGSAADRRQKECGLLCCNTSADVLQSRVREKKKIVAAQDVSTITTNVVRLSNREQHERRQKCTQMSTCSSKTSYTFIFASFCRTVYFLQPFLDFQI
jgi:hypothetical protein